MRRETTVCQRPFILQAMTGRWGRYLLHVAVWVLLYFLPYLLSFRGKPSIRTFFYNNGDVVHLVSFALLIAYSYVNYYFFVPKWYLGKRYPLYGFMLALSLAVVVKLPQAVDPSFGARPPGLEERSPGPPRFQKPPSMADRPGPPGEDHPILSGMNYVIILFLFSTFVSISVQQRLQFFRIEKEKMAAELSFLKAQINPHFLFNTLNSIYSLSLVKSDETPAAIIQLSDLMRYILRDAKSDYVGLEKELAYIDNYIALQRKRLGHTVTIDYNRPAYAGKHRIAPLLLMSFIENAFKHGVNPDEDSKIVAEIVVGGDVLRLYTFNNKVKTLPEDEWSGIGLQNAKERLQHLYPARHELRFEEDEKTFTVNLTMTLA